MRLVFDRGTIVALVRRGVRFSDAVGAPRDRPGPWQPIELHLARKRERYRLASTSNLVLCVDAQRRCGEGDLPPGARVVWFQRRIDPRAVMEAIERDVGDPDAASAGDGSTAQPATPEAVDGRLLQAIREVAAASPYGNAFVRLVQRKVGRRVGIAELLALCRAGYIALNRPTQDLAIRPLDPPRTPNPVTRDAVAAHIGDVVGLVRRGDRAPLYHLVREHFDWLSPDGRDRFRPVVEELAVEGFVVVRTDHGRTTIDVPATAARP